MVEQQKTLIILTIGVSDYSKLESQGYENLISANFDSVLVGNKFCQQGFTKFHLANPSVDEIFNLLQKINQIIQDFKNISSSIQTFIVIYFTGYAAEDNKIILGDGSQFNILQFFYPHYLSVHYNNLLIFQDCRSIPNEGTNFGEISCRSNSFRQTYIYTAYFRSECSEKFLKFEKNSLLTAKLLLTKVDSYLLNRNKVLNSIELFKKEKEFNKFMETHLTQCQNVVAGETCIAILNDFQNKLDKEVARLKQEKKRVELIDHIRNDKVSNQYCQIVDLIQLNMDPAENYHVLEFKFNYQKKLVPFTVIWTKNRLILLEISQKRKEIVGSYNVKYSASQETEIVTVIQSQNKAELYIITTKDKLLRMKVDNLGQINITHTFKIPERIAQTQITCAWQFDDHIVFGLNNGEIQIYWLSTGNLWHKRNVRIFGSHLIVTGIIVKRSDKFSVWGKLDYNIYATAQLNKSQIKTWHEINDKVNSQEMHNFHMECFATFIVADLEIDRSQVYKVTIKERHNNRVDALQLHDFDSYLVIQNPIQIFHYKKGSFSGLGQIQGQQPKYDANDRINRTNLYGKTYAIKFYGQCLYQNKIIISNFENKVSQFRLFESFYSNIKFAGALIWYSHDKFVATVYGEEGLLLCDFQVDKDLINALSHIS